jgi:hypothetical protein
MPAMSVLGSDPRIAALVSMVLILWGYLLVRYRREIGDLTGYFFNGINVTGKTPGCLLLPFGILFMLAGLAGLVLAIIDLCHSSGAAPGR